MILVDIVHLIILLVLLLHLDKFRELRDRQVKKFLSQNIFFSCLVELSDLLFGSIEELNSLVKCDRGDTWTFSHVFTMLFQDLELEGLNILLGDLSEVLLKVVDSEVGLVSILQELLPLAHEAFDVLLNVLLNLVLVHIKDSELLLHFDDSEFHVH